MGKTLKHKVITKPATTWKNAYDKMRSIAGEAIALADAYAGGESESASCLNNKYEALDEQIKNTPPMN
ncbi:MAG: hypothetical protein WC375_00070 [Methanomassiliicoccales archaeon]|jgi:hypothetical protein